MKCEAALENLRVAYWAAGKALEAIRGGRLYRAAHGTFEAYCLEQWDVTPQYAGKLIRSWRIAEKMFESLGQNRTIWKQLFPRGWATDRHGNWSPYPSSTASMPPHCSTWP
ncbi:hypothetical protein GCM10009760_52920 [Kitasatospora kazusensis]|uniref:HEPN domain-containing protein n=1 Tax=Kitasatospora kazusensis TaxID=407974 RepID=A0ABN3A600_9ACTN